jgi:hypothetical protein
MLKARLGSDGPGGTTIFLLGLSDKNVEQLRLKRPLTVNLALLGGPANSEICICWGKTENDIIEELQLNGVTGLPRSPLGEKLPDAQEGLDHGERYPRGKLKADDQGAMSIALAIKDNTLIIDFGRPTAWLGLGISDLERLIGGLQEKAAELRKGML